MEFPPRNKIKTTKHRKLQKYFASQVLSFLIYNLRYPEDSNYNNHFPLLLVTLIHRQHGTTRLQYHWLSSGLSKKHLENIYQLFPHP